MNYPPSLPPCSAAAARRACPGGALFPRRGWIDLPGVNPRVMRRIERLQHWRCCIRFVLVTFTCRSYGAGTCLWSGFSIDMSFLRNEESRRADGFYVCRFYKSMVLTGPGWQIKNHILRIIHLKPSLLSLHTMDRVVPKSGLAMTGREAIANKQYSILKWRHLCRSGPYLGVDYSLLTIEYWIKSKIIYHESYIWNPP